jgi:hypothetical protein
MFKFNFQSETDENPKEEVIKDEVKPSEDLKQSIKIEITADQRKEINENNVLHLNCFISR